MNTIRNLDEDSARRIAELNEKIQTIKEKHEAEKEKHKAETEVLKTYIVDMKGRLAVYVPVKTDPTDVGLAEYMNAYPDKSKLKIMFDREKESIYMYGTKRVTIKVNRGKPQVKIGGGFQPIEDFIDEYGPKELERLECRDPLNKPSGGQSA